jgi:hypothetical protein
MVRSSWDAEVTLIFWEYGGWGCWLPGARLLGAGEPGATPPLVASAVFLVVVCGGHSCAPAQDSQS